MAGFREKLEVIFGVKGANQFKKEFSDADKSVAKSSKGMSKSMKAIGAAAVAYLSFQTVKAAGSAAVALTKMADKFRVVQRSSERLAKSIGQDSDKILAAMRRGVGGAVTDLELLRQANQAILLGIPVTADKMGEMAKVATRLGRAVGRDATSAIGDLIVGIGRMSPLILDNLGITIKAEEAFRGLGEGATDAEKRLAFFNAVMVKATERAEILGEQVAPIGERLDVVASRLSNLGVRIGDALATPVGRVIDRIDMLLLRMGTVEEKAAAMASGKGLGNAFAGLPGLELIFPAIDLLSSVPTPSKGALISKEQAAGRRAAEENVDNIKALGAAYDKQQADMAVAIKKAIALSIANLREKREREKERESEREKEKTRLQEIAKITPRERLEGELEEIERIREEKIEVIRKEWAEIDAAADELEEDMEDIGALVSHEIADEFSKIPQTFEQGMASAMGNIQVGLSALGMQRVGGAVGNVGQGLGAISAWQSASGMAAGFGKIAAQFGAIGMGISAIAPVLKGIKSLVGREPSTTPKLKTTIAAAVTGRDVFLEQISTAQGDIQNAIMDYQNNVIDQDERDRIVDEAQRTIAFNQQELKAFDDPQAAATSGSTAFTVAQQITETQANSILAVLETQRAQDSERNNILGQSLAVQNDMKFLMSINSGNLLQFQG